jgi:hypothetical protein
LRRERLRQRRHHTERRRTGDCLESERGRADGIPKSPTNPIAFTFGSSERKPEPDAETEPDSNSVAVIVPHLPAAN